MRPVIAFGATSAGADVAVDSDVAVPMDASKDGESVRLALQAYIAVSVYQLD